VLQKPRMGRKEGTRRPLLTEEVQRGLRTGCSVALTMFLGFGVILPLVGGARLRSTSPPDSLAPVHYGLMMHSLPLLLGRSAVPL